VGAGKGPYRWKASRVSGSSSVHAWEGKEALATESNPTGGRRLFFTGALEEATGMSEGDGCQVLGPTGPCSPRGKPAWPLIARSPLEAVKPREGPVTPFEPQSSRGFRGSVSPRQEPETHDGAGTRFLVQVAEVAWSHLACSASLGRKTGSGARVVARRRLASPPDEGHGLRDGERVRGLLSSSFPGRGQTNPVADLGLRFQSDGRRLSRCVHGALTGFVKAAARLSGKARGPLRWYGSSGSGGKEASSGVPAGDTRTPEVRIRW
jgi:hypothetical protein